MTYILQTKKLVKKYGNKQALSGLDMEVKARSLYGFLGINGAGKTTTISILGNFIKPTSGSFEIKGKLSILPQDARFYTGRKIENQLAFFAELSGVSRSNAPKEAERVLKMVGLHEKKSTKAEKISHGMYKRLGIAQALLGNPDILLLDEPTAGLDPETAFHIRKMIKELGKEKTIVISSHNLAEIAEICNEIGIIHEGTMRFQGKIDEITQKGSSLDIHLSSKLDLTVLNGLKWIKSKKFHTKDQVLTILFDENNLSIEEANAVLIPILIKNNIGIRQIIQGKSLEKSFLEIIGKNT